MISICMYNKPINAVHVEVTDRCNSECPACARSAMGGPVKSFCMTCVDSCAVDKNISKQLSTLKI